MNLCTWTNLILCLADFSTDITSVREVMLLNEVYLEIICPKPESQRQIGDKFHMCLCLQCILLQKRFTIFRGTFINSSFSLSPSFSLSGGSMARKGRGRTANVPWRVWLVSIWWMVFGWTQTRPLCLPQSSSEARCTVSDGRHLDNPWLHLTSG